MAENVENLWFAIAQAMLDGTAKTPESLPPDVQEFFANMALRGGSTAKTRPSPLDVPPVGMGGYAVDQGGLTDRFKVPAPEPWNAQQERLFRKLEESR